MKPSIQKIIRYEPWLHLLFWGIFLCFPYIKYLNREGGYPMGLTHELVGMAFKMVPVYIAYFWFFPVKNKRNYAPLMVLLFIGLAYFEYYIDGFFHEADDHSYWTGTITVLIIYLFLALLFFAFYSVKQLYLKQQELELITNKKQQAELRMLKGQVNPHFLFNTLNTIYASALEKADKTPELILKLSDSFRYILTEGQKNKVPLKKELQHIRDFIRLQEERLSKKVVVEWEEAIDDHEQQIPPLLFISLVENTFKYSSMIKGEGHLVRLRMQLKNGLLSFYTENPFNKKADKEFDAVWKESGIGLENTRKRLQLLFPDKHKMIVEQSNGLFKAIITIEL